MCGRIMFGLFRCTNRWDSGRKNCFTSLCCADQKAIPKSRAEIPKKTWATSPRSGVTKFSVEVEVHFDGDFDAHGVTVFHRGLEFPILHRFNRLFIETHTQAAQ